jgi:hypothetical protein
MLPKPEQDRLAWTQNGHGVFVFSAFVRGFQYHNGPQLIARMKAEDTLDLTQAPFS